MAELTPEQQQKLEAFQKHVDAELAGDIDTTMATMADNPHVNHVPTRAGGVGPDSVRAFYSNHLVGKFFPPDVEMIDVSRTIDEHQLVDECVIRFTQTEPIDWMLPGVGAHRPVCRSGIRCDRAVQGRPGCPRTHLLGPGVGVGATRPARPRGPARLRADSRPKGTRPHTAGAEFRGI
ncbi:MAG: hypothetical protein R3C10_27800 [Pirellulales bacterium]